MGFQRLTLQQLCVEFGASFRAVDIEDNEIAISHDVPSSYWVGEQHTMRECQFMAVGYGLLPR